MNAVTLGKKLVTIHSFTGNVVGEKKWSSTEVFGGGGGYLHQGSGYVSNAPVRSTTTEHDQFFLRGTNGQEKAFEFSNTGLSLRSDHKVTVVWGIPKGKERGPYLAVYNHALNDIRFFEEEINKLSRLLACQSRNLMNCNLAITLTLLIGVVPLTELRGRNGAPLMRDNLFFLYLTVVLIIGIGFGLFLFFKNREQTKAMLKSLLDAVKGEIQQAKLQE